MLNETENRLTESHIPMHRWVKPTDHNGNRWSDEQIAILNHVAHCVEFDLPIRVAIDAVAGSGKTTVLRGILVLLSNAQNESASNHMSLSPMAFNRSIASVLADTMNAVKPDGADWVSKGSGTLNGHGLRTLKKAFTHAMKLSNAKYTMLSRWAVCNALADPLMLAEFDAQTPVSEQGNKRYQSSWFAFGRFVKAVTEKAMGYGLFVDTDHDYTDEWDAFLMLNRASLRITDAPIGPMIEEHLPVMVSTIIAKGMDMVHDPLTTVELHPDAHAWFKPDRYTTILAPVADMPLAVANDLGATHTPTLMESASCGGSIHRYRTTGKFGHARIQVNLPHVDDLKALNDACFKASWSQRFGHANVHADRDKYGLRPTDSDDTWVRTIKDTPEVINGFISTVKRVCGIDVAPLFSDSPQATEEQEQTATALVAHIDCIYAPIRMGLMPWRTFDLIIADEVQDMSVLQGTFMRSLMREGGNAVVVGDPKQSLYLFSGASSQSMSENIEALGCTVFPMTYCYRLTATLSTEVRLMLGLDTDGNPLPYNAHRHPDYIPSWPVGESSSFITPHQLPDQVALGDMVLCRIGSPLVPQAMACLRNGIPVRIAGGGDLEKGVRAVCESIGIAGVEGVPQTASAIEEYLHHEVRGVLSKLMRSKTHKGDEASARKDEQYINAVAYTDSITALVQRFAEDDYNGLFCAVGDEPQDWLADLFCDPNADGSGFVMFSSVHRAKGLESKRVFIITDRMTMTEDGEEKVQPTFMLAWSMNNSAEIEQEVNAVYVAITRAMKSNTFVSHDLGNAFYAALPTMIRDEEQADEGADDDDDESEPLSVSPVAENDLTPTDDAQDDSEATQDTPTHEFGMFSGYAETGRICCHGITESPAEAQAFLEARAQSFTTPYIGGTWLDSASDNKGMVEQVAVFAMWQDCPADIIAAAADPQSTWCKCIAFTIKAECHLHGHMADDDDDDGDAVTTDDDDDGDDGEAPVIVEPQSDDDDSTVGDEPQADVHPQALGCSWGDSMTFLATPTTFIRSMENRYADRSRVKPAKRADDLFSMVAHALECAVCREDIRTRCGRIPLSPMSPIDDSSFAALMNTTDGTIRRVLDFIADSTDQDYTTFSEGVDTGAWTILPLIRDERGEVYASCLRTPNGRIQRNTRVEFQFTPLGHANATVSEPIEETDDTPTVEKILEAIEETKDVFERVFAEDVDDSPQPVEDDFKRVDFTARLSFNIRQGVKVNEALLTAVAHGIAYGLDNFVNLKGQNECGNTPLHVVVESDGVMSWKDSTKPAQGSSGIALPDSPQTAEETPEGYAILRDIHGNEVSMFTLTDEQRESFRDHNRNAPMPSHFCEHDGIAVQRSSGDNFAYYTGLSYCDMKPTLMTDATPGSPFFGIEYTVWLHRDAESDEDTERITNLINDITNTWEEE